MSVKAIPDNAFNHLVSPQSPRFSGKMPQNPCTTLTGKCTENVTQRLPNQKILNSLSRESYHMITDG